MTESFPRQQARTRGFRLGLPRAFQVSPDGGRVTFLRSRAGDDPVTCLWETDVATGALRLVADPRALGSDEENLPPEERARRERVRETASGIVSYATDRDAALAVFALSGQVYVAPLGPVSSAAGGPGAGGPGRGGPGPAGRARGTAGRPPGHVLVPGAEPGPAAGPVRRARPGHPRPAAADVPAAGDRKSVV